MENKSSSRSFLFSEDNTHLFAAPNAFSAALSSSSAIDKSNSNNNASLPTVETLEVDLALHEPHNPPSPLHSCTSSSYSVPTVITHSGSFGSLNATISNNVADDGQLQRMYCSSSSVHTVSLPREGMKASELIVEPWIMCCTQIDSSKFIRDPLKKVLPRDVRKASSLMLFITARDKDVLKGSRIILHVFDM